MIRPHPLALVEPRQLAERVAIGRIGGERGAIGVDRGERIVQLALAHLGEAEAQRAPLGLVGDELDLPAEHVGELAKLALFGIEPAERLERAAIVVVEREHPLPGGDRGLAIPSGPS